MKKLFLFLIFIVSSSLFISCLEKLTKEGANVNYVIQEKAPKDCKMISALSDTKGSSSSDLIVRMRNKTATLGGNFLVIDVMDSATRIVGTGKSVTSSVYYSGAGRAYKCPNES